MLDALNKSTRRPLLIILVLLAAPTVQAQSEDEIDAWFDRAERYVARGQWTRAVAYLDKVLGARPQDEEAARLQVRALTATGGHEALESLIQRHREQDSDDDFWFASEVALLRERGRDDEALSALRRRVADKGRSFVYEAAIGELLDQRGDDKGAREVFAALVSRAKEEVVREPDDLVALARAYLDFPKTGYRAAEKALADAQIASPGHLGAAVALSAVYRDLDLPTDSEREIKDALDKHPAWPELLLEQARTAAARMGQAEERRRSSFAAVLATYPHHPGALAMRGLMHLGDAEWEKARADFTLGLTTNPRHRDCLAGMAALAWLLHDIDAFEKAEAAALAADPTDGRLYAIIAEVLSERRRWPEALDMVARGIAKDEADWRLHDDRARYALYLGQEEIGLAALKAANEYAPCGQVWRNNMHAVMKELADNYVTRTTPNFVVKLHKAEEAVFARQLLPFIERSFAEFVRTYDITPPTPIVLEVLRRHEDFSVRTMGTLGLGALGVCFGPTIYMDSPAAQKKGTYNWAATAHHEIAHVFTLAKSRGRTTRWLTEGLSSWEEVRRRPAWGRDLENSLHDLLKNGDVFPVAEFDATFRSSRITLAYYQGEQACRWIEETWGIDAIRRMLTLLGEDKQIEEVLRSTVQLTPAEFDAQFAAWLENRFAPLKRVPNASSKRRAKLQASIAAGENETECRIELALAFLKAGKAIDSDATLQPLIQQQVSDARIDQILGMRAWRDERTEVATTHLDAAIAAGLEDHDVFSVRAEIAAKSGKSEDALEFLRRAVATNPWSATTHVAIGRLLRGGGDLDGWASHMHAACDLVDTNTEARMELVDHHLNRHEPQEALALLEEVTWILPFDGSAHARIAEVATGLDERSRAIEAWEVVLSGENDVPSEFKARLAIAKLFLDLDKKDDASYHLERAVELVPDSEEARELLRRASEI